MRQLRRGAGLCRRRNRRSPALFNRSAMEMGGWTRLLIAGLVAGPVSDARAEGPMPAAASACHFEAAGAGKVSAIIDGRSFVLDDGREVRLAGIEVPFPPAPGETGPRAAAGSAARAALDSILAGQSIELRQRAPAFDRYGRTLAHVYVANEGRGRSVAHEMLATGYARVAAQVGDRACAAELLARERAARQAKLGLWGEPYYAIVGAESGAALLAERGQFHRGGRQGVVGPRERRHDLYEFRTAMVGGAHRHRAQAPGARFFGRRSGAEGARKPPRPGPGMGRGA